MNPLALILIVIGVASIEPGTCSKASKDSHRESKFLSFNSDGGTIDIDLDLSVPFLSIPLNNEIGPDGITGPLLNINTKAITVAGLMAAAAAFIVPIFFNKIPPGHRYRLDDDFGFLQMGNTLNDMILGNNYVTPCVQRAVCTLVARVSKTDSQTSSEKIIDGITSNGWFENVTNGTAIQEAVITGRKKNRDCSLVYKGCAIPAQIFETLLHELKAF